ncbi:MAG: FitA-like ribbon-helix-helix domain-containing protein [Rhizobiaceae bacterium]
MGQILVRNINDQALDLLRSRAIGNGTSLEAEVRHLIEREGKPTKAEILKEMQRVRAMSKGVIPSLTLDEIREGLE